MSGNGSPRVLFYSHDTIGLGHLRRTLLLCEGLRSQFEELSALVLTGSAMAHAFRMPKGIDYIKLPSVFKVGNERYESRSLGVPFDQIWRLRKDIIFHTIVNYRPDFFFVDNVPLGMNGEVVPALQHLRLELPATRIFLVLRDILDDKAHMVPFWCRSGGFDALEQFYDRIFIFGSPGFFDLPREYSFPDSILRKSRFCGYIPRPTPNGNAELLRRSHCPNGEKLVLVTLGGGSDGVQVVESYLAALPSVACREPVVSVIMLGPDMDRAAARRLMSLCPDNSRVTFLDFSNEPLTYMEAADCVVSMGGYNTISEVVWLKKKAIVIPRVFPRTEQLIRSQLLHQSGVVEMIHPRELTAETLGEELLKKLSSEAEPPPSRLDFTAIECLAAEIRPFMVPACEAGTEGAAV